MFDEETIQSAISNAIKTLQEQHRAELAQLKSEMQTKLEAMEGQMKELGKQVAVQTYQALVMEDGPLATKSDHVQLQTEMGLISTQLSKVIQMLSSTSAATSAMQDITTGPTRTGKRPNKNRTPEKKCLFGDPYTQENSDTSATSDLMEGVEGCED
jgi:hypothetical protein